MMKKSRDKKRPDYKPTVGGRASICTWALTFQFLTKEQCSRFIAEYLKEEIPINFGYKQISGDSKTATVHVVEIQTSSWANNLTRVAEILESVDYYMDCD
jgi:hypothetical protein